MYVCMYVYIYIYIYHAMFLYICFSSILLLAQNYLSNDALTVLALIALRVILCQGILTNISTIL